MYALSNILPGAIYCCLHTCCVSVVLSELLCMYANFHCYNCQYGPVIRISKRDCLRLFVCCLQTCSVNVVLMIMCCLCIPAFIVTSANISQLWVYFTNLLPEAICCLLLFTNL